MSESWDYIVVGAGSAGCIVAAELAADTSVRVLVIEAGQAAERNPETLRSDGYRLAFINDRLMWERFSQKQPGLGGHRVYLGSGRGVGGSGSVNGMVYTRGDKRDYEEWQLDGWRWPDLVPTFERLEQRLDPKRQDPTQFTEHCIEGAEAAGFRRKEDLNDGDLNGHLGYEWMNMRGPDRRSSYVAFLKPALERGNVELWTETGVERVEIEDGRAIGVRVQRGGESIVARASREVVLCAGALESPKLLLLSGVGPRAELEALGIRVAADVPEVGRNLQDHPNVSVFFVGKQPADCMKPQLYGFHRANRETALGKESADTCYVFYAARSSFREGLIRMLPAIALPAWLYATRVLPWLIRKLVRLLFLIPFIVSFVSRMWGIVVILGKPRSRGALRLASADPRDAALIDPAYFAEREDLDTLVNGVRLARAIADAPALSRWGNRELIPGRRADGDAKIQRFVRKNVMTTYHYAGTCRMGSDPSSVVTPRLAVRGVRGLRVADASVIPVVPVSAMNAPSMMIGLRAATMIAEDQRASG
jgi:choline dehydrogenase